MANNHQYATALLDENRVPATVETLTATDRANEYLMTSLRTARGCDLRHLRDQLGRDLEREQAAYLTRLQASGWATWLPGERLHLTDAGKLLADQITLDLFAADEALPT